MMSFSRAVAIVHLRTAKLATIASAASRAARAV
jgi:hypothetical protein